MLLMPIGVGSFNLLPKVMMEASDELVCTVNLKHILIYELMLMMIVLPPETTTVMLTHSTWT